MQFRGPALNGKYEYGCLFSEFSVENLSGRKLCGSGKWWGNRWVLYGIIITPQPAGITCFPEKIQECFILSLALFLLFKDTKFKYCIKFHVTFITFLKTAYFFIFLLWVFYYSNKLKVCVKIIIDI